ncbi:MAG: lamin tail domain-containing protein, partial [Chloroflexales bacterium]|nr:lamin tail domain-containing protein [Chloroflexales bacterium]
DPPGRDVDGEYVRLRNDGPAPINLAGWTLSDSQAKHTFTFPRFTLGPRAEVRLWTRSGHNNGANLYWGNRTAIWNNEGDSATLKDATGAVVSRYAYDGKKK